jgi:hypothetical protein
MTSGRIKLAKKLQTTPTSVSPSLSAITAPSPAITIDPVFSNLGGMPALGTLLPIIMPIKTTPLGIKATITVEVNSAASSWLKIYEMTRPGLHVAKNPITATEVTAAYWNILYPTVDWESYRYGFYLWLDSNISSTTRSAQLTYRSPGSPGAYATLNISQDPFPSASRIDPGVVEIGQNAQRITLQTTKIGVRDLVSITLYSCQDWTTVVGGNTFTPGTKKIIDIQSNSTIVKRAGRIGVPTFKGTASSGALQIKSNSGPRYIDVIQHGMNQLSASPSTFSLPCGASYNKYINVYNVGDTTNNFNSMKWTATSNASWISFPSAVSVKGTNSGMIKFNVAANPSSGARTGTISVKVTDGVTVNPTVTITITQAKKS